MTNAQDAKPVRERGRLWLVTGKRLFPQLFQCKAEAHQAVCGRYSRAQQEANGRRQYLYYLENRKRNSGREYVAAISATR
jgi:hypothetical protein